MPNVNFIGTPSTLDRTIFANKATIVKPPVPVLFGNNCSVISNDVVEISTQIFDDSYLGKDLNINSGPFSGRYEIVEIVNPRRLRVRGSNFDLLDRDSLESTLIQNITTLRSLFNDHILSSDFHLNPDVYNNLDSDAIDAFSYKYVLVELLTSLEQHANNGPLVGPPYDPSIHYFADPNYKIYSQIQDLNNVDLVPIVNTFNLCVRRYNDHRSNLTFHVSEDNTNLYLLPQIKLSDFIVKAGPFSYTIFDPRLGQIADDAADVFVTVNDVPASVDAVYGSLGAVVLTDIPNTGDQVKLDYSYLVNPPSQFERLNSFEFVLNQEKNRGKSGFPDHLYRQRSFLVNPVVASSDIISPYSPKTTSIKYKGFERSYTASLNDPNTLLLNVPTNRIMFPVFEDVTPPTYIRYDPIVLPENQVNPWMFNGVGQTSLIPNNGGLVLLDNSSEVDIALGSPFYSYSIDLTYSSYVYLVARLSSLADRESFITDGNDTGVGFGITDGQKASIAGLLYTDATNLGSAILIANQLKSKYSAHLAETGVHAPNDDLVQDQLSANDAVDLDSLITLCGDLISKFNNHIIQGPANIHKNVDALDSILIPAPIDEDSAIATVNSIVSSFNHHLVRADVHYNNDTTNTVVQVKQVGLLTSRGPSENQYSWNLFPYDWSVETSYLMFRNEVGDVSLSLSGSLTPGSVVRYEDLPNAADQDLVFDNLYQVFFGSLQDAATNQSTWKFIRASVIPLARRQVGKNKTVTYEASTLPEFDTSYPWITVGQGGTEYLKTSPNRLVVDSTSSIPSVDVPFTGYVTGEFRGYLRVEPTATPKNLISVDFKTYGNYYSFGIDNRSYSVSIGDGQYSTQFCFLQANPKPATISGTNYEGSFSINPGDLGYIEIDGSNQITITNTGPSPLTSAQSVADLINASLNGSVATTVANQYGSKAIVLTSPTKGASSSINLISGNLWSKLGFMQGKVFGTDSSPEPKMSWSGMNFPNRSYPVWIESGNQPVFMVGRILRIEDNSTTDYKSYSCVDPLIMTKVILPSDDWKFDVRLRVESYIKGDIVESGSNLHFCGAAFSIDEGPTASYGIYGKNIEVHLSVDNNDEPYLNILTYVVDGETSEFSLKQVAAFPFRWNDGEFHTYNIFTDKASQIVTFWADSVLLGAGVPYSAFEYGFYGPSVIFGTGSSPVTNCDLRYSRSITEWDSISAIHYSNLDANRYIGIYRGGSVNDLSSYYLHELDWTVPKTYRLVRDPISGVTVYVNGDQVPAISASYDVLSLPIDDLDFLANVVPSGKFIAFGSFNPLEISRTVWYDIKYSIGVETLTDGFVPPHSVLNAANVVTSSEHLKSKLTHAHNGKIAYSSGTPETDFLTEDALSSGEILLDGTPSFISTQNLESRGGLITSATPVGSLASVNDVIDARGNMESLEDDTTNTVLASEATTFIGNVELLNATLKNLESKYNDHIVKTANNTHKLSDTFDFVGSVYPDYETFTSWLNSFIEVYNRHLSNYSPPGSKQFHNIADTAHIIEPEFPLTLQGTIDYYNRVAKKVEAHINSDFAHLAYKPTQIDYTPDYIAAVNFLVTVFNEHIRNEPTGNDYHLGVYDAIAINSYATDILSACSVANALKAAYLAHIPLTTFNSTPIHLLPDTINTSLPANATNTLASLIPLVNALQARLSGHINNTGGNFHSPTDFIPSVAFYENWEFAIRLMNSLRDSLNSHLSDLTLHTSDDQFAYTPSTAVYVLGFGVLAQPQSDTIISEINTIISNIRSHTNKSLSTFDGQQVHRTEDFRSFDALYSTVATDEITSAQAVLQARSVLFDSHIPCGVGAPGLLALAHGSRDVVDIPEQSDLKDSYNVAVSLAFDILKNFGSHVNKKTSHLEVIDIPILITK
jgi:hypothetical protein